MPRFMLSCLVSQWYSMLRLAFGHVAYRLLYSQWHHVLSFCLLLSSLWRFAIAPPSRCRPRQSAFSHGVWCYTQLDQLSNQVSLALRSCHAFPVMRRIACSALNGIALYSSCFREYGVSPSPPLLDIVPDNQYLVMVFGFILS
jgi:hypothetical protein